MFRTSRLGLIVAAGICLAMPVALAQAPAPAAPTAEALVAKAIEAAGGLERIKAVRSFKQTGSLTTPDVAGSVPLMLYAKRPNLARQDVLLPGGNLIVAFDGLAAWKIDPSTGPVPVLISGDQADAIEQQADFDSPLLDYKAKGSQVQYVGAELFAGKNVQHLKVTDKRGRIQHCYLDADTGLEVRVVSKLGTGDIEQQLGDYRAVGGIKFPFLLRSVTNGKVAATITIAKVELDVPLDDAFFKRPR